MYRRFSSQKHAEFCVEVDHIDGRERHVDHFVEIGIERVGEGSYVKGLACAGRSGYEHEAPGLLHVFKPS